MSPPSPRSQGRTPRMGRLNGIDVDELRDYVAAAARDPSVADRNPVVVAHWLGAEGAKVTFASGESPVLMGGPKEPSAMKMLIAALAACDVDLIANRASLMGVEIDSLDVEATGHFNVKRYLGVASPEGPGYDRIAYTIRLSTKGATPEQLAELRSACEQASPVADTLKRRVALSLEFDGS